MVTSISDIMSKKIESVAASDNVQKAAKKMRDKNVSSLVVIDKDAESPVGILTERDLVRRVCAEGIDARNVPVRQILSSPLVTIDTKSSIEAAASVMTSNKVRHLLVVDSKRNPIGILTPSDFTKYLRGLVDLDEVNARILESLREEAES
jgi:CBS domain-containing protein